MTIQEPLSIAVFSFVYVDKNMEVLKEKNLVSVRDNMALIFPHVDIFLNAPCTNKVHKLVCELFH